MDDQHFLKFRLSLGFFLLVTFDLSASLLELPSDSGVAMAEQKTSQEFELSKPEVNVNVESHNDTRSDNEDLAYDPNLPDYNAQYGVKSAEAITLSWTKSSLMIVYAR